MEHHLVFLEEKGINSSFYFSSYILFRIYVDRQSKQLINYYSFQTGDRSLRTWCLHNLHGFVSKQSHSHKTQHKSEKVMFQNKARKPQRNPDKI